MLFSLIPYRIQVQGLYHAHSIICPTYSTTYNERIIHNAINYTLYLRSDNYDNSEKLCSRILWNLLSDDDGKCYYATFLFFFPFSYFPQNYFTKVQWNFPSFFIIKKILQYDKSFYKNFN